MPKPKQIVKQVTINVSVRNAEDVGKVVTEVSRYISTHKNGQSVSVVVTEVPAPADDLGVL